MATRFRTAARLTSKPPTDFERHNSGYDAGKAAAFRGERYVPRDGAEGDPFAEGYSSGYWRVAGSGGLGR